MTDTPRLALFIDGASLYGAARAVGFDIDFRKLLREFERRGRLLRAHYYTVIVEDQEYSSLRPLTDWLAYNGYHVVTKAGREFTDAAGRRRTKGSMDIELTVDALALAPRLDELVLFSSDGDFRALVEAVQRQGVRVTVVSTVAANHSVADELRRQADVFLDLAQLAPAIGRDPRGGGEARAGSEARGGGEARAGDARPAGETRPPVDLERRYGIRDGE